MFQKFFIIYKLQFYKNYSRNCWLTRRYIFCSLFVKIFMIFISLVYLQQYWKKAYGHPIIGKMACPLVEQIFKNMDKSIDSILNNMKRR